MHKDIDPSIGLKHVGGKAVGGPPNGHRAFWGYRHYTIIYLNHEDYKRLVIINAVMLIAVAIMMFALYLYAYNVEFFDPIQNIKSTFLTTQLISIAFFAVAILLLIMLSTNQEKLLKLMKLLAVFSIFAVIIFAGIKIHFDNTYTKEQFAQFYETYKDDILENNKDETKIAYDLKSMKILDEKETYISESVNAYTQFKTKTLVYLISQLIVSLVIIYIVAKLSSQARKRQELKKDDSVLFDEEKNIKF